MRRWATILAAATVAAACASGRKTARVVPLEDTDANLRGTPFVSPEATATTTYPAVADETAAHIFAEFFHATYAETPESATPTASSTPTPRPFTVRTGESWTVLSKRLYGRGDLARALARANGLDPAKAPRSGSRLRAPDLARLVSATPAPTATAVPSSTPTLSPTSIYVAFETRKNRAFGPGEKLTFEVQYMGITGGTATMEIAGVETLGGRSVFHVRTAAQSTPLFSRFFRVNDQADSFVDTKYLFTHRFEKRIEEGKFRPRPQHWVFDQAAETATDHDGKVSKTVRGVQDILSAFYFFRTMRWPETEWVSIPVFTDGKTYELLVKVARRETISVPCGTFRTVVVEPQLKFDGLFQQKGKVTIWLTDDERRVPVLVKSKIVLGSIDIVLVDANVLQPVE